MTLHSLPISNKTLIQCNEFGQVSNAVFTDVKGLTQTDGVVIEHQFFEASISLYGGHVLTWQPKNQQPVFWLSRSSLFGHAQGIRGGIPLCFPWFGHFDKELFLHNKDKNFNDVDDLLLSNHGFARIKRWQVETIDITSEHVKVVLTQKGDNITPAWDIPYQLKQTLIFGKTFSQTLSIVNHSSTNIEYTGALHSYFAVGDPKDTYIDKLSSVAYFDKLQGTYNNISTLENCEGPIDRIYQTNHQMHIKDRSWNRAIQVTSSHCQQWVLWNPGKKTADSMSDVHSGGEKEYVCLEAANTSPIVIRANSSAEMAQHIELTSLKND